MTPPRSLLLVPPLATVSSLAQQRDTFHDAIATCISTSQQEELFVALPLDPQLLSQPWHVLQSILAHAYALLSAACVELDVPCEDDGGPGSVATTVILLRDDLDAATAPHDSTRSGSAAVTDASAFAARNEQWKSVAYAQGDFVFITRYLQLLGTLQTTTTTPRQITLPPAPTLNKPQHEADGDHATTTTSSSSTSPRRELFRTVCLGGTFDHLHLGHKLLLHAAMLLLDKRGSSTLIVGITGDALLENKKFASFIQPWEDRARAVLSFTFAVLGEGRIITNTDGSTMGDTRKMHGICAGGSLSVHCAEINDAFGPTITREDMDALVVSGETRSGGEAVNDKRRELGWRELVTFAVDVLNGTGLIVAQAQAQGQDGWEAKLSSTAIRKQRFKRARAAEQAG